MAKRQKRTTFSATALPSAIRGRRPRAFIVHGRDLQVRDKVSSFLQRIGFFVLNFEDKAGRIGAMPAVSAVVRKALDDADVVIVLFTPDETAILYDSGTGLPVPEASGSRWQARPNVIFEAGWAFGLKPEHTLFVTVGEDTSLFSDVGGLHFIQIDRPGAARNLWNRLRGLFSDRLAALPPDYEFEVPPLASGRWKFHDELSALHTRLSNIDIETGRTRRSLLDLLAEAVEANETWTWADRTPADLITYIKRRRRDNAADQAFWWLATTGFFQFNQIDTWGDHWEDSIDSANFARRGLALLEWLAARSRIDRRSRRARSASR